MELTHTAAQCLMLAAQGLCCPPASLATRDAVLTTIRRMGALQIDTIHVVARSPYLVLWSRLGDYTPGWLDTLLAEVAIFEYWSHEACFLPIEDYPLYRRRMLDHASGATRTREWITAHQDEVDQVLAFMRERGAVRSADFPRVDGQASGWWNWKPEKQALEYLHSAGEVMIAFRRNFQRYYDLRERVLPDWDDARTPDAATVYRALTLKAMRALGVTTARWVPDYFRTPKQGITAVIEDLVREGSVLRVQVAGWDAPAYVHQENLALAEDAAAGRLRPTLTTLLSPFDPLIWDRARTRAMFGFDYTLECYTPAAKRRYGYFSLPILWRGALVGRLDAKAHRKDRIFEVKTLQLEPGVGVTDELVADLAAMLRRCAAWHQTPQVVLRQSAPPDLAARLQGAIG